MANRKNKAVDQERCKPSMALNAVCPYYTMFPLSFPVAVLERFEKRNYVWRTRSADGGRRFLRRG
jgi:hypothetical protein